MGESWPGDYLGFCGKISTIIEFWAFGRAHGPPCKKALCWGFFKVFCIGKRVIDNLQSHLLSNLTYMVLVVGVTGGIASGKSSVCTLLQEVVAGLDGLSLVIIDGDKLGHRAYEVGTPCYDELVAHFGPTVVAENKAIDRRALGSIVFGDPQQMRRLEAIVWPHIRGFIEAQLAELRKNSDEEFKRGNATTPATTVVLLEAAVLLEAQWEDLCDVLWVTHVDPTVARERLMQRNGFSAEEAGKRIDSQMSNTERLSRLRAGSGDVSIDNSGSSAALKTAVNQRFHEMMASRSPVFRFMSPLITRARSDNEGLGLDHPLPLPPTEVGLLGSAPALASASPSPAVSLTPASPLSAAASATAVAAVNAATAGVAGATAGSPGVSPVKK